MSQASVSIDAILCEYSEYGSACVLHSSQLAVLGALHGDALRVTLWPAGRTEADASWAFLCSAAVRAPSCEPEAPAVVGVGVQLPPHSPLPPRGASYAGRVERLGRPAGCATACFAAPTPHAGLEALLRGRLLCEGAMLHISSTLAFPVLRCAAASPLPARVPLRILPSTALSFEAVASDAAPAPPARGGGGDGEAHPPFAGPSHVVDALTEALTWPTLHAELARQLGVTWPRGFLLHGPPGCGKSLSVRVAASSCGASLRVVTPAAALSPFPGEAERSLRAEWAAAVGEAAGGTPVILFFDEAEALFPHRSGGNNPTSIEAGPPQPGAEGLTHQLVALFDSLDDGDENDDDWTERSEQASPPQPPPSPGSQPPLAPARPRPPAPLVVVAATTFPDAIDSALRRPRRFEAELEVGVPDAGARGLILAAHTARLRLSPDVDITSIASKLVGYSPADCGALAREAALEAVVQAAESAPHEHHGDGAAGDDALASTLVVCAAHFAAARARVGPSLLRGADAEPQPLSWGDVGGCGAAKAALQRAVEWPLKIPAAMARLGLRPPKGVLLHGPPGCGKTRLARAAAHECQAALLPLSCAALFSLYLGDGERALRSAFARARSATPAIILLDEADAVGGRRAGGPGGGSGGGSGAEERLLCCLLSEMDAAPDGVLVIAATNRKEAMDPALLRPGRLEVHIFVGPPEEEERLAVLKVHTRRMPLSPDVDLGCVAVAAAGASGAELAAVCAEAGIRALREDGHAPCVAQRHFMAAVAAAPPRTQME